MGISVYNRFGDTGGREIAFLGKADKKVQMKKSQCQMVDALCAVIDYRELNSQNTIGPDPSFGI